VSLASGKFYSLYVTMASADDDSRCDHMFAIRAGKAIRAL